MGGGGGGGGDFRGLLRNYFASRIYNVCTVEPTNADIFGIRRKPLDQKGQECMYMFVLQIPG